MGELNNIVPIEQKEIDDNTYYHNLVDMLLQNPVFILKKKASQFSGKAIV